MDLDLAQAAPPWALPMADRDDDWSGVMGDCHAARPAPEAAAPLPADDAADWGYESVC
jgi:hypothetical protein